MANDAGSSGAEISPGNIHNGQVATVASRLRSGVSLDEAVQEILEATQRVGDPSWNWKREEEAIRGQGLSFIAKNPELAHCLPDGLREQFNSVIRAGGVPRFKQVRGKGWMLLGTYTTPPEDAPGGSRATPPARRSRLIAFGDVTVSEDPECFIDGILPREGIGVADGPPKVHKTFWVFDMVMHAALGRPYRGRGVQQAPVVYCAFEGQHGFAKRIEAYKRHHLGRPRRAGAALRPAGSPELRKGGGRPYRHYRRGVCRSRHRGA